MSWFGTGSAAAAEVVGGAGARLGAVVRVGGVEATGPGAGGGRMGVEAGCGSLESTLGPLLRSAGAGNLKLDNSDAGKAENGPSWEMRLIGGLPRVLPLPTTPLRQADDTTLGPCLLLRGLGLEGVIADFGSSTQKALPVDGVIADWGYAVSGVCATSELIQGGPVGWAALTLSLRGSETGKTKTLPLPSGWADHGPAPSGRAEAGYSSSPTGC